MVSQAYTGDNEKWAGLDGDAAWAVWKFFFLPSSVSAVTKHLVY